MSVFIALKSDFQLRKSGFNFLSPGTCICQESKKTLAKEGVIWFTEEHTWRAGAQQQKRQTGSRPLT